MKDVLAKIEKAQDELSQHSQSDPKSLPAFLRKFTKPLEIIREWATAISEFCVESSDNQDEASRAISKLETEVQDLEQRLAQLEQTCVDKLRDFVEANQ
ncbi:hypothetical protein TUMSATVNIG1_16540 [Vibrio nigripulchritudo]|uniref:hypothetical protein n=1 Tax=Vibrio nigripulchritudo TaxID=28173 RepID=UPI00190B3A35|nr:hypothetical protein [Vibrio nigripulchritudo]BCL69698.1 hypothetical protein VNTUMSATTG_16350 [Vibrio nigripulchritudo]BDU31045.1 hypothetical protein TUMSATVNIG1_16540 [Vibrio nigripulchritudo]